MQEELKQKLYERMVDEQEMYEAWLKKQSAEEVLNHTYEYTIRQDVVTAMEDINLPEEYVRALLDSPTPLADVYKTFEKMETDYMDTIRASIIVRAKDCIDFKKKGKAR